MTAASGADGDSGVEPLSVAREEARQTLEAQLSTLDDIDSKAVAVFRLNVAVVGVLLSALSFAAGSDVTGVGALLTPLVGAGVWLFALSATAAGLTYTAVGQQVGVGPAGLRAATDASERVYLRRLVDGYAGWIRANERTNERKALLVTVSIVGTVAGTVTLLVGVVAAFTGVLVGPALLALAAVVALVAISGLPGQLRRLLADGREPGPPAPAPPDDSGTAAPESQREARATTDTDSAETPFAAQRTFKGRDRRE